jgi:hypothetical protein
MGQILKCMPMYMTRDKYYDNVYASLSAAFAGESKEFIAASLKAFEGFCSPQENPVYGKYFPEIAEWIGQKRMVLPHKMNDDELSEFYEELKEMFEVLEQIEIEAARCGAGKKGGGNAAVAADGDVGEDDPMLRQALELAVESGKISTSLIQRRLQLGYGRAAKLIDRMEQMGYVSPPDGQRPRKVLISKQEFMEMVLNNDVQ